MKHFFDLLFHFKWRELFVEDTNNGFIQFFRFCFVGAVATLADMGAGLIVRSLLSEGYSWNLGLFTLSRDAIAGAGGFIVGLIVNYLISISWVFKRNDISRVKEFTVFAVIGVVGLAINTGVVELMGLWIAESTGLLFIFKKIVATLVTLVWNFSGRKLILYRNKPEREDA